MAKSALKMIRGKSGSDNDYGYTRRRDRVMEATANSLERGSAFYRMMCFPDTPPDYAPMPKFSEREVICTKAPKQLIKAARSGRQNGADRMADGEIPFHPDGSPFEIREIMQGKRDGSPR